MRRNKILDYLFLALLVAATIFVARYFGLTDFDGPVVVVDGDSLRLDGRDIRLHGIDAPELNQQCSTANGNSYQCGRKAKTYLRKLVSGKEVTCKRLDVDRYGRDIAVCTAGKTELNMALVQAGWAVAYLRHSFKYARAERQARKNHKGIWQGQFDYPQDWRQDQR